MKETFTKISQALLSCSTRYSNSNYAIQYINQEILIGTTTSLLEKELYLMKTIVSVLQQNTHILQELVFFVYLKLQDCQMFLILGKYDMMA